MAFALWPSSGSFDVVAGHGRLLAIECCSAVGGYMLSAGGLVPRPNDDLVISMHLGDPFGFGHRYGASRTLNLSSSGVNVTH
jgi:hypothetical protein